MNEKILTTPAIERVITLVKECVALGAIGVVVGPPGTGKTTALLAVEKRYPTLGLPGGCFYYRCCSGTGPTRGVRDLLVGLGMRESLLPVGFSLQMVIKIALREFESRSLRVLLCDEADTWGVDALRGVLTMADISRQKGQPLVLILGAATDADRWLGDLPSALSRTLRFEFFENLSVEMTLSVLQEWGPVFQSFAGQVEKGDKEAVRTLKLIHKGTGGNFRKLHYFAQLFLLHNESAVSFAAATGILKNMLTLSQPKP
jgi:hypothetical protein